MAKEKEQGHDRGEHGPKEKIHIFINKIKFDETQGVKSTMKGGELADLVSVPHENAKITRLHDGKEIGINETIEVKNGEHFEVIRKVVAAGYGK